MARRKRTTNRLHAGGAVALVGGLVLALSFLPGATGVPLVLEHVQRVALGDGAWLIPLAGVLGGIALLRASEHSRLGRRAWGAALIALVSVAAYHARVPRGAEWSTGLNAGGGGVVGGALLWVLRRAFGETGAWLMLALSGFRSMNLPSQLTLSLRTWSCSLRAGMRQFEGSTASSATTHAIHQRLDTRYSRNTLHVWTSALISH